jgi:enterochelin esterase-like enzyme
VTLRRVNVGFVAALGVFFLAGGIWGAHRYLANFLTYRGFDPPTDPSFVAQPGTSQKLEVRSAALGGRAQEAYVYLPSGYAAHPSRRYPVVYLLHGFPGRPLAWLETVRMGVIDDALSAKGRAQPAILVMPFGSTGTFDDEEWADGARPGNGWATFVARDLVRDVDAHFRTVPTRAARAIAGLSEGGYGAINIALHHPGEFSVVESWSGYEQPDKLRSIFGAKLQLLPRNDPQTMLPHVAPELRKLGTYFWFYSGTEDHFAKQNRAFARELTQARIPHHFFESFGGHNWALWRKNAPQAFEAAMERLRA